MKLLEKFNQFLGFTPSESKIILILVGSFILGWGIKGYRQSHRQDQLYDYSAVDSEFQARSSQVLPFATDSLNAEGNERRVPARKSKSEEKININTATKDELVGLPGIGDAMAERIILYREDHGPFATVEELVSVRGIGKKKVELLIPLCTTGE